MKKTTFFTLFTPVLFLILGYFPFKNDKSSFHKPNELAFLKQHQGYFFPENSTSTPPDHIPIDSNILFPTGKVCGGCHGHDPNNHALITTSGVDVNMYDDWRATMMANAAKDPFWRAKVSHESLVNPGHSAVLQDKCTTCHAPAGNLQSKIKNHQPYYGLSDLYQDTLGLDGVNCQICHAQSPASALGNLHSGAMSFDTNKIRVAYGPYEFAFAPPMHNFVGITPLYGEHINDSGICAGCHTLITKTADLNGEETGDTFVEQATYHEWLNSKYDEQHTNKSCQSCHMPRLLDEIIISTNYLFLTPKFPYAIHELAGANTMMLKLLKENREQLGIKATEADFDSTIVATLRMLKQKSVDLSLTTGTLQGDTAYFDLKIVNKAGHKFPSGYPARRAWVEFEVKNEAGQTVFHSGKQTTNHGLLHENPTYEPHYDVINQENQVQIYELVTGDVAGNYTSVLERGKSAMKDNRLVPQGFSLSDPAYDTTKIVGHALTDLDFNYNETGAEGSGADVLHFHIPNNNYTGRLSVHAKVWYQSLSPKFVQPMFDYSSPEIDSFKLMFQAQDNAPVLVSEVALDSVFVTSVGVKETDNESFVTIFPNPTHDRKISVNIKNGVQIQRIKAYNAQGKLVVQSRSGDLTLPEEKGIYLLIIETKNGKVVKKIVLE
jgi:Secretion system C-terminal sorting domain/Cytochrome c554 and c-prime